MIRVSPIVRISIGLVLMTVSILFAGQLFGLLPDSSQAVLDGRKKLCELLAVQFSSLAQKEDLDTIRVTMKAVVDRNDDILSAAMRLADGTVIAEVGEHRKNWVGIPLGKSTPTHAQVPIFSGAERWGTVQIRFTPLGSASIWNNVAFRLIGYVAIFGFIGYLIFMRKTLRALDPSSVIPARVKSALDALTEGVILLDERENVVLANTAFAKKVGLTQAALLGRRISELTWVVPNSDEPASKFPWSQAMRDAVNQTGVPLSLVTTSHEVRTFMVNGAPILDAKGKSRGALATFDDVTELEQKNTQLEDMLKMLEASRDEVSRQNRKLRILATHDPLTNCLNRRAFFQKLEAEFVLATRSDHPLCCIMADIDHFKTINDRYGHGVGDQVIQKVADTLRTELRNNDIICRYGGEEFCVLLPRIGVDQACRLAERIRVSFELLDSVSLGLAPGHRVTTSLGVTCVDFGAPSPAELVDQADQALYASKNSGRNRVTRFDAINPKKAASA